MCTVLFHVHFIVSFNSNIEQLHITFHSIQSKQTTMNSLFLFTLLLILSFLASVQSQAVIAISSTPLQLQLFESTPAIFTITLSQSPTADVTLLYNPPADDTSIFALIENSDGPDSLGQYEIVVPAGSPADTPLNYTVAPTKASLGTTAALTFILPAASADPAFSNASYALDPFGITMDSFLVTASNPISIPVVVSAEIVDMSYCDSNGPISGCLAQCTSYIYGIGAPVTADFYQFQQPCNIAFYSQQLNGSMNPIPASTNYEFIVEYQKADSQRFVSCASGAVFSAVALCVDPFVTEDSIASGNQLQTVYAQALSPPAPAPSPSPTPQPITTYKLSPGATAAIVLLTLAVIALSAALFFAQKKLRVVDSQDSTRQGLVNNATSMYGSSSL